MESVASRRYIETHAGKSLFVVNTLREEDLERISTVLEYEGLVLSPQSLPVVVIQPRGLKPYLGRSSVFSMLLIKKQ